MTGGIIGSENTWYKNLIWNLLKFQFVFFYTWGIVRGIYFLVGIFK